MANLLTLIVTESSDLKASITSCLNKDSESLLFITDIKDALGIIEEKGDLISTIVAEIPSCIKEFETSLRRLKREDIAKYIPCIGLLTPSSSEDVISRQLFFHMLKLPLHDEILPHTVEAAQSDFKRYQALLGEVNSRTSAIGLIKSGKFRLQTLQQAEALTTMLSMACPEPAIVALGLSEILVNAIEHGNLDISYEEKSQLLEAGRWENEVTNRLTSDTYKDRFVEIHFDRHPDSIKISVTDQGDGFDWKKHVNNDPSNNNCTHGRGIAIAIAMGFSNLEYNDKGNSVCATISL